MRFFLQRLISPPARYAAPLLVLLFGGLNIWLNYRWNLADDLARGQKQLLAQADATGQRLTRLGEQLRVPGGLITLQADLAASAKDPELALAAFVDSKGWILVGSSSGMSGQEARQTLLRAATGLMQPGLVNRTRYSADAKQLYAAYPVAHSDSWVLLIYDRSVSMHQAHLDAWRSLEWSSLMMLGIGLGLWAVLHFGFARRITQLSTQVQQFGQQSQGTIHPIEGSDEVALLSRSFAQMAQQVRNQEHQRQQLEKQVLSVGEAERRRIGHELHDGLGQKLTAAALNLDALEKQLIPHPDLQQRTTEIAYIIREAISETRQLSHGLAPTSLHQYGLKPALEDMLQMIPHEQIRVIFEADADLEHCPNDIASQLYRIAQEACNNVLKHAHASELRISLTFQDQHWILEVEDDGEGPPTSKSKEGIGLQIMRHRALLLNGNFEISAAPAGGTLVRVYIPHPPDLIS